MTQQTSPRFNIRALVLLLVPIILLAAVITLFLSTGGGLKLTSPAPVETLDIERHILKRGSIELQVRNTGPEPLKIGSVIINNAVMPFEIAPSSTIPRLGRAHIHVNYAWIQGE